MRPGVRKESEDAFLDSFRTPGGTLWGLWGSPSRRPRDNFRTFWGSGPRPLCQAGGSQVWVCAASSKGMTGHGQTGGGVETYHWFRGTQRGARQRGAQADASKRKQIQTNTDKRASKRRGENANKRKQTRANASKREQTQANANKRLHPPLLQFLTRPPLQSPYI